MPRKVTRTFKIVGVDAGFRKLGLSLVLADKDGEKLVVAETIDNQGEDGSTMQSDVRCCWILGDRFSDFIKRHKPDGIFVEMPGGGGQGARAHRCMGLATGVATEVLRASGIPCQIYSPGRVEDLLGIKAIRGDKSGPPLYPGVKLTKAGTRAWKKARLEEKVLAAYPDFEGWPKTLRLKEDAVDSVAAVLAGKAEGHLRLFPSVDFEDTGSGHKESLLGGLE
jgi:Holliday junction resolvasome RuvABC endonuclease subunit